MKLKPYTLLIFICFSLSIAACKAPEVITSTEQKTEEPAAETSPEEPEKEAQLEEPRQEADLEENQESKRDVPRADREYRAAWVATVANINWPSRPGISVQQQQKEAIELLDLLKANNFNAVVFQVRPQADALYQSDLEPWSYYLTGEQGKAPEPFYDPLHFWIEAAHDRGLELHAWLNPYRAQHSTGGEISDKSVIKTNPELVLELENGMWWMDPAKEGTKEISTAVVMDLVKRYDLDGIHFDDYFYPYPSYNNGKDFPDDESWKAYQNSGGELSRGDWRRDNVNSFIKNVYESIKAEKPHVKFGLSPFGIWRPGYPESIVGYDQYEELYADAKLWLNEGWVDYFTPQLYWRINPVGQSFPVLLGWWSDQNYENRHLWPGINAGLGGDEKNEDEVINQIMITRGMLPESPGVTFWSIAPLVNYPNLGKAVLEGPYKRDALVPASPWLDNQAPEAPIAVPEVGEETVKITWVPEDANDVFRYVVYFRYGSTWSYQVMNRKDNLLEVPKHIEPIPNRKVKVNAIAVTTVDRTGNESEFIEIAIK